jgi:hypothetical protein
MANSNLTAMMISDDVFVSNMKNQLFVNTIDYMCSGNLVFGKIKICRNDNGETMKVYYDDKLIFDEKEYLEQDNQFIRIIRETNV